MRRRSEKHTAGVVGDRPAAVIPFDEMWTYRQARRWGQRRSRWVWTAVVEEPDGRRWTDFEMVGREARPFLRLYGRLPEAELYYSDGYRVYDWLPADRHLVGKGGAVNRNEGLHSFWRGKLNRLRRRTKGYSKRGAALRARLALAWVRHGLI